MDTSKRPLILLACSLFQIEDSVLFGIHYQHESVTRKADGSPLMYRAKNGVYVNSNQIIALRSDMIHLHGPEKLAAATHLTTISVERARQLRADYVTALNDWAEHHEGTCLIYNTDSPQADLFEWMNDPKGFTAIERNPGNILYMLADALLREESQAITAGLYKPVHQGDPEET